jgi:excinuclease ABC subunit A
VGTVTEVYDYLRLLFARVGTPHCPQCGRAVSQQSAQEIVQAIRELPGGIRILLLAPLVKDRKGHHRGVFDEVRKAGFLRVRVDGKPYDVNDVIGDAGPKSALLKLDRYKMHTIEAVIDRLVLGKGDALGSEEEQEFVSRLTDSVETALRVGNGTLLVQPVSSADAGTNAGESLMFSEQNSCAHCSISLPDFEPRSFSFNSPHGACAECQGLGHKLEIDPALIIPDGSRTLQESAIAVMEWRARASGEKGGYYWQSLQGACKHYQIPVDRPITELSRKQTDVLLYGSDGKRIPIEYLTRQGNKAVWHTTFEGVIGNLRRRYRDTGSEYIRRKIERYMTQRDCDSCHGQRLRAEALAVTIGEDSIVAVTHWPVTRLLAWALALPESTLNARQRTIGRQVLKEITSRLQFMANVGLDYLTLDRSAASLSGGEAQRIRLATQIGSQLTGVLYVLDEPSIGLHQRDNGRLIDTLKSMRDLGNTLLVVEHDEETIRAADWVVDLGPGAGSHGGEVVAQGTAEDISANPDSLTGAYLSGRRSIAVPPARRSGNGKYLLVRGAREHNLKGIDVRIPLGKVVCITGVSGSGKSTLMNDILYRAVARALHRARAAAGMHDCIEGLEHIDKIINIDQSSIGRTPRSNPATYVGLFDHVRKLFSELPESKIRGYRPGRYSFNVKGGRCEGCQGQGQLRIEMQFLPDIYVPCDVCNGARYNRETLQVCFKDLTIADTLALSIEEAAQVFANFPAMQRKLSTLLAVGLGYIKIGQPATTLSGGEAQRVKLSKELSKRSTGRTLYVLDEPSVGLHAADVDRLIEVLQRFADQGNTVVIIEHHPDIVKVADHVIDLGPEGGDRGGEIMAEGTPEQVMAVKASYTGQFLPKYLET